MTVPLNFNPAPLYDYSPSVNYGGLTRPALASQYYHPSSREWLPKTDPVCCPPGYNCVKGKCKVGKEYAPAGAFAGARCG